MDSVEITVDLGDRSYPIVLGTGTLEALPNFVQRFGFGQTIGVVTDTNVAPLLGNRVQKLLESAGHRVVVSAMPAGEEHKRIARVEELIGDFLAAGMDRTSGVIALGGGVVGDVAGYTAASFMRGVPYIQVPTTIVAQVDSSVGGKTGVNHPTGKNIIGAFHQPSAVVIDMALLATLPDRELRAGLAEVIKHGVIADAELFGYLEKEADHILTKNPAALAYPIRRSCEIKAAVVAADERESGVRANLNYGHTFGHGIEASTHYKRFLHGEAVALGMHAAGVLSRNLGMVNDGFVARQRACIMAYGLPVAFRELDIDATLEAMKHDKKVRGGTMKFIVAERMGSVVQRTDVPLEQARAALQALAH